VRLEHQVPDLSYDIYISSGGPGSPLESEHSEWEKKYFHWLQEIEQYNNSLAAPGHDSITAPSHNSFATSGHDSLSAPGHFPKQVLFICHSFQLICRHYAIANVTNRKSTAFGVFPVHIQPDGLHEPVFEGLQDPFYAVDSRDYQVIQPDNDRLTSMGAHILAIEKERPLVPLERAIMAVRFNQYMIGTQFHPEADPGGMSMYLQREDRKKTVIAEHGEEKWSSMIEQLNDPDKIRWTNSHVIPNFLNYALIPHHTLVTKTA